MLRKSDVAPVQSILAGGAAGGIESFVTYPTEYVKTRLQLLRGKNPAAPSPLRFFIHTIRQHGISHLYTGGGAFCTSNASKSGVRFLTFDAVRQHMPKDSKGKTTVIGNILSGGAAGIAESLAVLTPGETIKTKMIQDRAGPQMYRSTTDVVRAIFRSEGAVGFYRGVWPVILKQSANAMVRFTCYNYLVEVIRPPFYKYRMSSSATTATAGALAGIVTVYCTMPFDNIKTQLQSIEGKRLYSGSLDCARKLVTEEGIKRLWKGTTPRLFRLSASGAISFSVYEQVVSLTSFLAPRTTVESNSELEA